MLVVLSSTLLLSLSTHALAQVNTKFFDIYKYLFRIYNEVSSDWTIDDKNVILGIKFASPDGPGAGRNILSSLKCKN
jgi:hypothetical protein